MNLAQITIVGNLAGEPESRTLADGRLRTRFRVAATSRALDPRTGRWRDGDTTFLAVVAWRGLAAAAAGLHRGARVVVVGHLRQYDYARDGQRETGYEVQAQEIALGLPRRRAVEADGAGAVGAGSPS
ncbi:MAG TPA: single-stranded DNA-binding protein [Mycobacteriales bacterium]|nr:single-stranded DNA-binding protein [Mycobacteriales bacterium]